MTKKTTSLILALLLTIGNSLAQEVFQSQTVAVDASIQQELNKWYKNYEIVEFDLEDLNKTIVNEKENIKIEIRVGDKRWNLNLYKNELRSSNYKSIHTTSNGKISQGRAPCSTYMGYANDNPDNHVRLAINDEIFRGYIVFNGVYHYFNQLRSIVRKSNKNVIVTYIDNDLKENNSLSCAVTNEQEQAFLSRIESSALALKSGTSSCRILELATDADFEWFELYGNNANDEILAIVNMIQGTYQTNFNLEIMVVFQNVFTTASDPYTAIPSNETGAFALVGELRTYWENNFTHIERDVVHLFSGKESGVPYGYIGYVYEIGSICLERDKSYGFTRDIVGQFKTTAHEIGHHFGGVHAGTNCSAQFGSVMCKGADHIHPSLYFSSSSTNTIEAFMNSNSACLLEFENIEIEGEDPVCNNQTKTYTLNTPLNGYVTWSVNNNKLIIVSEQGLSTVSVKGSPYLSGTATLSASIPVNNCDVVVTKSIWVGKPSVNGITGQTNPMTYDPVGYTVNVDYISSPTGYNWSLVPSWGGYLYDGNLSTCHVVFYETEPFHLSVYVQNACGSEYEDIYIDVMDEFYMMMSPNPADGEVMISIMSRSEDNALVNDSKWDLEIYGSNQSIKVKNSKVKGASTKINTHGWGKGIYIVKVKYKDSEFSGRLLVE